MPVLAVIGQTEKVISGHAVKLCEGSNILITCANIVLTLHTLQGGQRDACCPGKVGERHFLFIPQVAEFFL
jgi:hypothetical protein